MERCIIIYLNEVITDQGNLVSIDQYKWIYPKRVYISRNGDQKVQPFTNIGFIRLSIDFKILWWKNMQNPNNITVDPQQN